MSFIDLFGGSWTNKTAPSTENLKKRSEMMAKQQVPKEALDKLVQMTSPGADEAMKPTTTIKQLEEEKPELYSFAIKIGDIQVHEMRFRVDGIPESNNRELDGKEYKCTCSFEDGVWTAKILTEGCPDLTVVRKREGEEMIVKETCEELCIEEVAIKAN